MEEQPANVIDRTPVRRELDLQGSLLMLVFCVAVGLQQVAIKAVAEDIAPVAQIALRSIVAALLAIMVAYWRGVRLADVRATLRPGLSAGALFASEFGLIALALGYTTASHVSVFLYTAPIFAALGLHFLVPNEQLALRHWIGIGISFGGMTLAIAGGDTTGSATSADTSALLTGDLLATGAGVVWAATTVLIRTTSLSEERPTLTQSYQVTVTAVLLLPIAALQGDLATIHVTPLVLASLTFQTFGIAFGTLLLWFALLRRYLASRLGVFSFLSPIFGVIFGAVLLGDPLTVNFIVGGLVLLVGVILVSAPMRRHADLPPPRSSPAQSQSSD